MKIHFRGGLFIILLIAGCTSLASAAEMSSSDFEEPNICANCHLKIYTQWYGSMHSNSHVDPFYRKEFEIASRETNGSIDPFCASCHTPIGILSEEVPPRESPRLSEISKRGISCDFCHTVSGSAGIGNAAYVNTPGGTKLGPFEDSVSPYHGTAYSELHTKAEFCGMCHNVNHPVNGVALEATYTEWKEGPYSKEGVQCQDCHMTPGVTGFEANPGKAASMGPQRAHVWTHYFVGGNAPLPHILGTDVHEERAIERLRSAAALEIDVPFGVIPGEEMVTRVKVTNVGAGHKLPTGLTEARQMWIEVVVADASGKRLYGSGLLDGNREIEKGSTVFHTVLGDKNGQPTEKVWLAESVLFDNRIAPRGSATSEYVFTVPLDAAMPLNINAKLKYRSASQHFADKLFGKGFIEVPVVDMVEAEKRVEVGSEIETEKPALVNSRNLAIAIPIAILLLVISYALLGKARRD